MSGRQKLRLAFQIVSLAASLAFLAIVILGTRNVIHQACPYAVVCFGLSRGSFIAVGTSVAGLAIVFGFAVAVWSMFYGRRFCAYLCPLGTLQEFIYKLRGRKYRLKHQTAFFVDRKLAWLKYLILLITMILSALGLGYVFIRLCPFYAMSLLPRIAIPGLVLLAIIVVKSFFGEREWCRFLCPYAALMNVFQKVGEKVGIRRRKIRRNLERCTDCGLCMLYCPMNINIAEHEFVHDLDCIHCGICAEKCPKPGTYSEECECPE